jgi:hypothetical protein
MKPQPHTDWIPYCPKCVMKEVCDEWGCPSECTAPMPTWIKNSKKSE